MSNCLNPIQLGMPRALSTTIHPPDKVKAALLSLVEAKQACGDADWSTASPVDRINAASLIAMIEGSVRDGVSA